MASTINGRRKPKLFVTLRKRHGDNCHWCGLPMCFRSRERPLSATIEHLVPRSRGGTNEQANLRLAHKRCNQDRSEPTPRRVFSPFYPLLRQLESAEE